MPAIGLTVRACQRTRTRSSAPVAACRVTRDAPRPRAKRTAGGIGDSGRGGGRGRSPWSTAGVRPTAGSVV
eukprot:365786-Chlamydomonas_euryale.AAC.4